MRELLVLVTITVASTFLNSFAIPQATDGHVVIINKENPVSNLSTREAKLYFLRKPKSQWRGTDENIRPVTRKSTCAERDAFYAQVLKMSDADVEKYFAKRQFQNEEETLDKVNSDSDIIDFVQREKGAIGFISAKSLTPGVKARVKVVLQF